VRVNSRRVGATYRLQLGDRVRIPPIRVAAATPRRAPPVELPVVFEDDSLLVVDKPAGIAVHGGSGVSFGVIERLRSARPQARFLELAHRLDRETSGLLVLAKRRPALVALHAALREGRVRKRYLVLVKGRWRDAERSVDLPLLKSVTGSGERRVRVDRSGREALTVFRRVREVPGYTLLEAELMTGRTHQIRVHLAHIGFALAGDDKYGDFAWNKALHAEGLRRMFLHAHRLVFRHPIGGDELVLESPLPADLTGFLARIDAASTAP
jgi:23S rRNA pseudouridine955/2504/2580 synthase